MKGDGLLSRPHTSIAILELSIEVSNSLMEACTCCSKFLSKVCVKQHLEALDHVCDEAHITKCHSQASVCQFDHV